ncbi:hypothetical protein AMTR_s00079p00117660 [Amborella trichopoda]|uniref:Uncharacterized protein n=1 Tax=Amborella trichopoda TaxID=13333 RepID=W1P7R9_AMBTC|nr:hypothetical protein AMTR_s00079p00117660 [Amborella trichopoda]
MQQDILQSRGDPLGSKKLIATISRCLMGSSKIIITRLSEGHKLLECTNPLEDTLPMCFFIGWVLFTGCVNPLEPNILEGPYIANPPGIINLPKAHQIHQGLMYARHNMWQQKVETFCAKCAIKRLMYLRHATKGQGLFVQSVVSRD